jgi:hypothetical protein
VKGERTVCCPDVHWVSAARSSSEKTVVANAARDGLKEDFVYLFTFSDSSNAGILITIYLAVFNAFLVVAVLT